MSRILAAFLLFASAGSLIAHHSLTNFDTTKPFRVKGRVVQFNQINPHSFIFLEERDAEDHVTRYAIEGPSVLQLGRTGFPKDALKYGDIVEVCGYLPKAPTVWQIAKPENETSLAGKLMNAELIITPDGKQRSWGDYGVHKCFPADYTDQHTTR